MRLFEHFGKMIEHFDLISEVKPKPQYKMLRNFSNSNPSIQQMNRIPNGIPDGGIANAANSINNNNVQVEYEVSVPIVQSFRHTPYHSLWNLNQWLVKIVHNFVVNKCTKKISLQQCLPHLNTLSLNNSRHSIFLKSSLN